MLFTILLVLLILGAVGALPTWGYSRAWGPGPSSLIGLLVLILIICLILGVFPTARWP